MSDEVRFVVTPGVLIAVVNSVIIVLAIAKGAMEWQKLKSAVGEHGRRLNRLSKAMLMISKVLIAQGIPLNPIHEELEEDNNDA